MRTVQWLLAGALVAGAGWVLLEAGTSMLASLAPVVH
jgi:hypothetical protein